MSSLLEVLTFSGTGPVESIFHNFFYIYQNNTMTDDWEDLCAMTQSIVSTAVLLVNSSVERREENLNMFGAHNCILRDYISSNVTFVGKDFEMMFRTSRTCFQAIYDDIAASGNSFFFNKSGRGPTPVARLLRPLKCLACGVPAHTFTDYFPMSRVCARDCCIELDVAISELYEKEYLRIPTPADFRTIEKLLHYTHILLRIITSTKIVTS